MSTRADKLIARVDRAEAHLTAFCNDVQAYFRTKPIEVAVKPNPNGGYPIYWVSRVDAIPHSLAGSAGDLVHNLRSALDNTAYQLALDGNRGMNPNWNVYFPIASTKVAYEARRKGVLKTIDKTVEAVIDAIEPWKDGSGHALWQLAQISNKDKHEVPLEAAGYSAGVDISADIKNMPEFTAFKDMPSLFLNPADKKCPLKVGDELYIGPAEPEHVKDRQFKFDVAVHAPGVVPAGVPAAELFTGMAAAVRQAVQDLAAQLS